jgi:sugar-specific transcriptional regulator TrmB
MSEEAVKKVLKNSGLTEKEAEVYIFLARNDALKSTDVAKLMAMDRAHAFHILKRLQAKNVVESTLEFPTRYLAVPFEKVIESTLKAKQEEVAFIEEAKEGLLDYLKRHQAESSVEKIVVLKGNKKIYSKIKQIVQDTKHQLSAVTTISDLICADRYGVFDPAFSHPLKAQIQYRFITEASEQNLHAIKTILKRNPLTGIDFKARNPELGLRLFPRVVARDGEEILLFNTPVSSKTEKEEVCLWTNCKSLVQTFMAIFENLWRSSTDLNEKIAEIENGKSNPFITTNVDNVEEFRKILYRAEKEVVMITSAEHLVKFWGSEPPLKRWVQAGVSVKIMTPITKENLSVIEQISKFCKVKHVVVSQLETTLIDGTHLFQFKMNSIDDDSTTYFTDTFYSRDIEYVGKVKVMLDDLWRSAQSPSPITLEAINNPFNEADSLLDNSYTASKPDSPYRKMVFSPKEKPRPLTEKEVVNKIIHAKKHPVKEKLKDQPVFYGRQASAVIHPPKHLELPYVVINVFHWNEMSSFGVENWLVIHLWLDTPKGGRFVPVATVQDRPVDLDFRKNIYAGTPAAQNCIVLCKDEFQVQTNGNILFTGWTKPIPLLPPKYVLPPSCLLFEGYGTVKPGVIFLDLPSGFKQVWEYNGLEAFVTFFHPTSKYSGPATDGTLARELIITNYPPQGKEPAR